MDMVITDKWNEYLDLFEDSFKDIYYVEEYVKLYENDGEKALCIVCSESEKILLMPFIRKEIDGYYDFETPYGYGGPIANTTDDVWIGVALKEMADFFKSERYVCGFVRFHSILNNKSICEKEINVIFDRHTIAINTSESQEEIWNSQINSQNRNMIRKTENNGLVYKAEYDFASLPDFVRLYNATMKRIGADDFYFLMKIIIENL